MRRIIDILSNKVSKRIMVAIAAAVVIVWFYPHQRNNKFFYEEGQPWYYAQLIAPFDIPIHPDSATVEHMRDTLQAKFVPIYTFDSTVVDSIIAGMPASRIYRATVATMVRNAYEDGVVSSEDIAKVRAGSLPRLRVLDKNIMSERSSAGLISVRDLYARLDSLITDSATHRYFTSANLNELLRPNLVYDEDVNRRHFDNEFQILTADRGVILQGQAIINKGDIVTAQDFTNLQTYEQLLQERVTKDSRSALLVVLGQVIYVLLLLGALIGYCSLFYTKLFDSARATLFIFSIVTLFFLLSAGLSAFIPGGAYIVPMAMVPILTLVFMNPATALFVSYVAVLIIAPITTFALEYIFLQFVATTVAVYSLRDLRRRSQLLRTASLVAVCYIGGYLALELLMNGTLEGFTWRMPVFLIVNALLTSMAYILMFPIEKSFGFVSTVTLTELADTNQTLLRKLSDVCPGTFQHSMGVGNLAADAARAIGVNEQLVRTGALYHDIGKMNNPAFFTENQHGVNPHDALPPDQSARIVIGHVTDGLRMAEKAGIPAEIRRFISEHHGAGITKYFFYTYCNAHPDEEHPDKTPFTYPGPNPQSRETSLLMMADAVEAASRSLKEYTREAIVGLVDRIIDSQISEGLHAASTLEFRDVPLIKEAFVKRLSTMYHTRVEYPKAPAQALKAMDAENEKQ